MNFSTAVPRVLTMGLLIAVASCAGAQQPYPNKAIRFITPYVPGGTTTILVRLVAQKLTESWGQAVIVDNRPGGNTIIGTEALVKSPPDGYTILLVASNHVTNVSLLPRLPYDTIKDFAAVGTIAVTRHLLVLNPSVPANTLQEFIALAKSTPGQLNYASSGGGSPNHLAAALFENQAGVKMQHIPYKGSGQLLPDLVAGQVQLSFQTPTNVIPQIKSSKLKAVAISGEARLPSLPQVPTFSEAGLPGFDSKIWYGVLAPAGTPKSIIDKLSTEIVKILAMPDIMEKLDSQGMQPLISSPDQFVALMKADMAKFAKVIKAANIKLEN